MATRHLLDRIHGTAIRAAPGASAALASGRGGPGRPRSPRDLSAVLGQPHHPRHHRMRFGRRPRSGQPDLAVAEAVIGVFYSHGGWRAALDEARAAIANASGDEPAAARFLRQAAEGFGRWGQRLEADRCRRASGGLLQAGAAGRIEEGPGRTFRTKPASLGPGR